MCQCRRSSCASSMRKRRRRRRKSWLECAAISKNRIGLFVVITTMIQQILSMMRASPVSGFLRHDLYLLQRWRRRRRRSSPQPTSLEEAVARSISAALNSPSSLKWKTESTTFSSQCGSVSMSHGLPIHVGASDLFTQFHSPADVIPSWVPRGRNCTARRHPGRVLWSLSDHSPILFPRPACWTPFFSSLQILSCTCRICRHISRASARAFLHWVLSLSTQDPSSQIPINPSSKYPSTPEYHRFFPGQSILLEKVSDSLQSQQRL